MKLHRWISNAHRGGKPDYLSLTVPGGQGLKLDIVQKAQSNIFLAESLKTTRELLEEFIKQRMEELPEFVFCEECEFCEIERPYLGIPRVFCNMVSFYVPPSIHGCYSGRRKGS